MAKEGSVAPQERVNITYKPATGDAQSEVELPLKLLFIGDYTGRVDERPLEERKPISVDKDNFNEVLAEHKLSLSLTVPNRLAEKPGTELSVKLELRHMNDFSPDAIVAQVPELKRLLELRQALAALKGPLGNVPAFRKKLQSIVTDAAAREKLMRELGIDPKEEG